MHTKAHPHIARIHTHRKMPYVVKLLPSHTYVYMNAHNIYTVLHMYEYTPQTYIHRTIPTTHKVKHTHRFIYIYPAFLFILQPVFRCRFCLLDVNLTGLRRSEQGLVT